MTATVRGVSIESREGTIDVNGVKTYTVIFKVQTNDKRDGAAIVRVAPGIPSIGDTYSIGNDTDPTAVVIDKQVNQVQGCPFEWEVTVICSNDMEVDPAGFVYQDNPLAKPPDISYGIQTRRILVPGRFNNPIGPPADKGWQAGIYAPNGDLFEPQPETEIDEPIWTFKRNVATVSGPVMMALNNCVNADPFQGAEPRQLRLKIPTAVRQWHKSIGYYWEVTYTLIYRWETWDIQILNQGYYYWSGGKPTNVWSTTTLASVKRIANGELRLLNLTTNGDLNTGSTPTFTRIRFFREVNFGSLGIV